MECPKCNGETTVRESYKDARGTYRIRKCKECGYKFPTTEEVSDRKKFNR